MSLENEVGKKGIVEKVGDFRKAHPVWTYAIGIATVGAAVGVYYAMQRFRKKEFNPRTATTVGLGAALAYQTGQEALGRKYENKT